MTLASTACIEMFLCLRFIYLDPFPLKMQILSILITNNIFNNIIKETRNRNCFIDFRIRMNGNLAKINPANINTKQQMNIFVKGLAVSRKCNPVNLIFI